MHVAKTHTHKHTNAHTHKHTHTHTPMKHAQLRVDEKEKDVQKLSAQLEAAQRELTSQNNCILQMTAEHTDNIRKLQEALRLQRIQLGVLYTACMHLSKQTRLQAHASTLA